MKISKLAVIVLTMGSIGACQQTPHRSGDPFLSQAARQNAKLVLNKQLTIPTQRARTYLQDGREVSFQQRDRFAPNCEFEVRTLRNTPTRIEPDTFTVDRVRTGEEGSEGFFSSFITSATIKYETFIRISSPKQPDVLQLTCSWEETSTRGHHLTMPQFEQAVGALITLQAQ